MSVVQRGKQARWPSAGGPRVRNADTRGSRAGLPGAEKQAALRWLENRDAGRTIAWYRRLTRALWSRCNYLHAPVLYPWSASRKRAGLPYELHRVAERTVREEHAHAVGRLWLGFKALLWPVLASAATVLLLWRCGRRVRDAYGIALREQFFDLMEAAWRHGIFPAEYYHHGVFRMAREHDRSWYLCERELRALLRECARAADPGRVNDVSRFMLECRLHGLPAPRTPAVAACGRVQFVVEGMESLPQKHLFLRPALPGNERVSGEHWRWNAQTKVWMFRGQTRDAASLLEHAMARADEEPWVIQEAFSDHPDITRFSAGGVCTTQIVTAMDERGAPEILFAALHLPASADGGWGAGPGELVAEIDVASGRTGPAIGEFAMDGEFSMHPATGVMIEDVMVPQWSAMSELARRAHERFAELPFVSWRIALSGGGPILVEASSDWGVLRHVWPARTRFAQHCLRRLDTLRSVAAQAANHPGALSVPVAASGRGPELS